MKEKILITGANGFIGNHLVHEAVANGFEVFASVRKNSNVKTLKNSDCNILEIDLNNIDNTADTIKENKFDYIIHNIGKTKASNMEEYLQNNKDTLVNLVNSIRKSGLKIKKLVFISSLAAYGPADHTPGKVVSLLSTPNPISQYGKSKLAAERFLSEIRDIPYLIIRPTATYGPLEKDLLNVFLMIKNRIELVPGLLGQKLTFIYVKDLARLIMLALKSDKKNTSYFVTDGHVYTGDALSGFIKQYLNHRTLKIKVPVFLLKILAYITEKISSVRGIYPPLNRDKVNELTAKSWVCDVSDLKADLGFIAEYDLPRGIAETVQWYKEHKWI